MRLAKKQHAQSGLTDTAADGAGQLAFEQHSMVGQVSAVITACLFSADSPERLHQHGYPWRKFPERYPEQRYRTANRRLTASHHNPENGCHGARRNAAYRQSA